MGSPAPASSNTLYPEDTSSATVSGVSASRFSVPSISRGIPITVVKPGFSVFWSCSLTKKEVLFRGSYMVLSAPVFQSFCNGIHGEVDLFLCDHVIGGKDDLRLVVITFTLSQMFPDKGNQFLRFLL